MQMAKALLMKVLLREREYTEHLTAALNRDLEELKDKVILDVTITATKTRIIGMITYEELQPYEVEL